MELKDKIDIVKDELKKLEKVVVAFSGGKDSFFLLKLAYEALGEKNVKAIYVITGLTTKNDEKRINYFRKLLNFSIKKIFVDVFEDKRIVKNHKQRCYYCKKKIFTIIKNEALKMNITHILDGTTESDLDEYRPGMKAIEELKILSPLKDAGINEMDVAEYLKSLHIEDYYLTSSTCLATRFPYDFELDEKMLKTFDDMEYYLVKIGIFPVKVRYITDGIRIETSDDKFLKIFEKKEEIINFCKKMGIKFVTLDIDGIKTGIWD